MHFTTTSIFEVDGKKGSQTTIALNLKSNSALEKLAVYLFSESKSIYKLS